MGLDERASMEKCSCNGPWVKPTRMLFADREIGTGVPPTIAVTQPRDLRLRKPGARRSGNDTHQQIARGTRSDLRSFQS